MIQSTTSLRKIASLKKRIWAIRGSQGSAKTYSILLLIINHCSSNPDKEVFIVSAELTKMRNTVIKDFVKLMKATWIYDESKFLAGTLYRFPNNSFIKFIGLDKEDVGKGLRCDIVYFNEVNKCDQESYEQMASRAKRVIMDYNPDAEFFVDTDVITDKDCDFLQLTFEDNELLDINERNSILKYKEKGYNEDGTIKNKYFANKWQVYGLGNIGNLIGAVFENWKEGQLIPFGAEFICYALDWGFTNDQTGLISVHRWNGELYAKELIYETRLTNTLLANKMRELKVDEYAEIIADSADPKSIEELRNEGFNVIPAKKGPDSVRASIDILQRYHVNIIGPNFVREMRGYKYKEDVNGKSLNVPNDGNDHLIDPLRYAALNKLGNNWVMDFA
jgi:phage terminase large subunit